MHVLKRNVCTSLQRLIRAADVTRVPAADVTRVPAADDTRVPTEESARTARVKKNTCDERFHR